MRQSLIFLPFTLMMIWTLAMMIVMVIRRGNDASRRGVSIGSLPGTRDSATKLGEGPLWSARTQSSNDHVLNLFETPILFYALCLALFVTNSVTTLIIITTWTYLGIRVVHGLIHISYNHVFHRFVAFGLSLICLTIMIGSLLMAAL